MVIDSQGILLICCYTRDEVSRELCEACYKGLRRNIDFLRFDLPCQKHPQLAEAWPYRWAISAHLCPAPNEQVVRPVSPPAYLRPSFRARSLEMPSNVLVSNVTLSLPFPPRKVSQRLQKVALIEDPSAGVLIVQHSASSGFRW
jgi:hypothetical protein